MTCVNRNGPILSSPTRWGSVYAMLVRFLKIEGPLKQMAAMELFDKRGISSWPDSAKIRDLSQVPHFSLVVDHFFFLSSLPPLKSFFRPWNQSTKSRKSLKGRNM